MASLLVACLGQLAAAGVSTPMRWSSTVYPGQTYSGSLYVPRGVDRRKPAALLLFNDGKRYERGVRDQIDELIRTEVMPPTVVVFVNPSKRRSDEYDSLDDTYARFLIADVLPVVAQQVSLIDNPHYRAIGGFSSGAICAWTAAWQRPDVFRKVVSHVGSYVAIKGGDTYPELIRSTEPKPIRIWLQSGRRDLDNQFGNWPRANILMHGALRERGYDHRFRFGLGAHSVRDGLQQFPETMRWLWRYRSIRLPITTWPADWRRAAEDAQLGHCQAALALLQAEGGDAKQRKALERYVGLRWRMALTDATAPQQTPWHKWQALSSMRLDFHGHPDLAVVDKHQRSLEFNSQAAKQLAAEAVLIEQVRRIQHDDGVAEAESALTDLAATHHDTEAGETARLLKKSSTP